MAELAGLSREGYNHRREIGPRARCPKALEGTVHLPERSSKSIELAMLGYREERLMLVGEECKINPINEQQ